MQEVEEMMEEKVKPDGLGFSWKELHFILSNFWRNKAVIMDSTLGITPSLHRFGVSTSSKWVRQCKWIFMMNVSDPGDYLVIGEGKCAFRRCCKDFVLTLHDASGVEANHIVQELTQAQETVNVRIESALSSARKINRFSSRLKKKENPDSVNDQGDAKDDPVN